MRCPDCNKFVSFDTDTEPETSLEVDEEGTVTGNIRIVNTCGECGTELKEANLEVELVVHEASIHNCGKGKVISKGKEVERPGFSILDESCSRNERSTPGKTPRYTKHFYGYDLAVTIQCEGCKAEFKGDCCDDVQASAMEELV